MDIEALSACICSSALLIAVAQKAYTDVPVGE